MLYRKANNVFSLPYARRHENFHPCPAALYCVCSRGFDEEPAGCGEVASEGPPPNSAAKTSNKQRQKGTQGLCVACARSLAWKARAPPARPLACPAFLPSFLLRHSTAHHQRPRPAQLLTPPHPSRAAALWLLLLSQPNAQG